MYDDVVTFTSGFSTYVGTMFTENEKIISYDVRFCYILNQIDTMSKQLLGCNCFNYCDNLFVKRSIPTVCFAHMGINPRGYKITINDNQFQVTYKNTYNIDYTYNTAAFIGSSRIVLFPCTFYTKLLIDIPVVSCLLHLLHPTRLRCTFPLTIGK